MADVALVFLAIAGLTFVGFGAGRFFERTRFPDIPLLLLLGLLLGPVNRWAAARGFGSDGLAAALDPSALHTATPFMAALALVVLLFDSGMQMDFLAFRRSLGPAALHTLPIFVLNVVGIAALGHFVLGMPYLVGAALGVALSNVDQSVSAGVLKHLRISSEQRAIYFVEMTLYDLLSIPILVAIIQLAGGGLGGNPDAGSLARSFASLASVSLAVGLVAGLSWIYALRSLHRHPNSYMLTFAMTLATYGLSEGLAGSGALSILVFGLIVGNRAAILRRYGRVRDVDTEHEKVQAFHNEISFFVRTIFFLFLGISFTLGAESAWPTKSPIGFLSGMTGDRLFAVAVLLIVICLVVARLVPVRLAAMRDHRRKGLFPVFGRGLDTAVLATLPFLAPAFVPGTAYHDFFAPWQPIFTDVALLVILLTVLASSFAVFGHERSAPEVQTTAPQAIAFQERPPPRPAAPPASAAAGRAPAKPPARRPTKK